MIFLVEMFAGFKIMPTFATAIEKQRLNAEIAQLVEHNLAKVRVASSSLVFRSMFEKSSRDWYQLPKWRNGRRARFRCEWLTAVQVRVLFWALICKQIFDMLERWRNW